MMVTITAAEVCRIIAGPSEADTHTYPVFGSAPAQEVGRPSGLAGKLLS